MLALVQWFTRYILHPNVLGFIVSEISALYGQTDRRTDGQTSVHTDRRTDRRTWLDLARSTLLVILIKSIYTLEGRKRFLLPITYFPSNLETYFSTNLVTKTLPSTCYNRFLLPVTYLPLYSLSNWASFYLLHTFDKSSILFYSSACYILSAEYNYSFTLSVSESSIPFYFR